MFVTGSGRWIKNSGRNNLSSIVLGGGVFMSVKSTSVSMLDIKK